ncbi:glycosyltransferase family A protein [Pedobacter sp. R20-19]|uniref:glycosyltransferase family 2 protein n=1 Tax=Pedobacter sp. R20-19 TaxID=1270196 RepID=UPI00049351F8|nr:glycosyltransferase family A protein [Pedobacter sp. R20-19]
MLVENKVGITVLIPVYNGSLFLEETIKSLLKQTYHNFEIIFVNDSSTDNSLDILERYAALDDRIKVLTKPNGGTASKAINFGLVYARGEYFMYSSQDDLFSEDLLEKNFIQAKKFSADAVVPVLSYFYGGDTSIVIATASRNDSETINGREAFVASLDWQIHGFVLWKIEIVKKIGFFEFGLNSDEYTTRMFYFHSETVVFSTGVFFYRQNNPNAITQKWSLNLLDILQTGIELRKFALENGFGSSEINKIHRNMFYDLVRIKLILLANKHRMTLIDYRDANWKISSTFQTNLIYFKTIQPNNLIEVLKLNIMLKNIHFFNMYCTTISILKNKFKH